ncbi:MAG: hypothetical protein RR585_09660 [Coprobacillus sp.]
MLSRLERADRAKIFLSFDALKGFRDYLKSKERILVSRKELLADTCDELDWKIQQIEIGRMVKIVYYDKQDYVSLEGMVTKLDLETDKKIMIVDKLIDIKDIVGIQGVMFDRFMFE